MVELRISARARGRFIEIGRRGAAVVALCVQIGCEEKREAVAPWADPVGIAGCRSLTAKGVCQVNEPAPRLTLWLSQAHRTEISDCRACQGLAVSPLGSGALVSFAPRGPKATLRIRRGSSELDGSSRELVVRTAPYASSPARRAIELGRKQANAGEYAKAAQTLGDAAAQASTAGHQSEARYALLFLAYSLVQARQFQGAQDALDQADAVEGSTGWIDVDATALQSYTQALFHRALDDTRRAERSYEHAQRWVERGAHSLEEFVRTGRALTALSRGAPARAARLFRAQLEQAKDVSPCFRATLLSNLGWSELMAVWNETADEYARRNVTLHLREAIGLFDGPCQELARREGRHAKLSLAFDALRRGSHEEAATLIAASGEFESEPRLRAWHEIVDAELKLATGAPEKALRQFDALSVWADEGLDRELQWRAREGQARALRRLGRLSEAVDRYRAAERLLSHACHQVPLYGERVAFLGGTQNSLTGLTELLLKLGRTREAFDALRHGRRRVQTVGARTERKPQKDDLRLRVELSRLRAELERDAERLWMQPADRVGETRRKMAELRRASDRVIDKLLSSRPAITEDEPLRRAEPGELLVAWFHLSGTWYGFSESDGDVRYVRLDHAPQAGQWTLPLAGRDPELRRVTLLDSSEVASAAPHMSLWKGHRLIERTMVRYSLDLPRTPTRTPALQRAVLVSNTRGDLPHASAEALEAGRHLEEGGMPVRHLAQHEALLSDLRNTVDRADLLLLSGHGKSSGRSGWSSAFLMADDELTAAEVLAWPEVPSRVVLSACDVGKAPSEGVVQGLGLAQAFVAAGASEVLATSRQVTDASAREVSVAIVSHLEAGGTLEQAFREAVRATTNPAAWASHRILTP